MSLDDLDPLAVLVPKPLSELSHDNPELHFIGTALLRPTIVKNVVPGTVGSVGVLPSPAREDHVHGMASTGSEVPPLNMDDVVGGILDVQYGGTGQSDLTVNTYLKGNGTSPVLEQPTPIPVPDGGTGTTFLNANHFVKGNGASALFTQAGINLTDINTPLIAFTPTFININLGVGGTASGYYQNITANIMFIGFVAALGSSGFSVTSGASVAIPGGRTALLIPVISTGIFRDVSADSTVIAHGEVLTAGTSVDLLCHQVSGTDVVRAFLNSNTPFLWEAGDIIRMAILTFVV